MKQIHTHQQLLKVTENGKEVSLSLSKYKDCLFVIVNETGAPGSILEGKMTEVAGQIVYEEDEDFGHEETSPLYQMKVLFGSSQIEFYELFLRRILSIIWQDLKPNDNFKTILNISLPILSQSFDQQKYYQTLMQHLKKALVTIL